MRGMLVSCLGVVGRKKIRVALGEGFMTTKFSLFCRSFAFRLLN